MPMLPKRFCRKQGCNQIVESGYCDKHKAEDHQRYDRHRGTAHERGYDSRWRKARDGWLRKHPLCAECERSGVLTAATVVDHITPHKGDNSLFWDRDNWQSLCKRHHDIKTVREDGGFGMGQKIP